ncbi:MAG: phytochelatin synthase family protein [Phycisphaeraceae bacterium]|nr:phytochelatin synthase family protein [Phycisphaeraceae bacterium]
MSAMLSKLALTLATFSSVLLLVGCVDTSKTGSFRGPLAMTSPEGVALLEDAESLKGFSRVIEKFETQATQTYCGVASSVIALHAVGVTAPEVPQWKPYRAFTQESFFDGVAVGVVSESKVRASGMTLDELGRLLEAKGARAEIVHADMTDLNTFRQRVRGTLRADQGVVLVNYHRPAVAQPGGGHISPLGAYSAAADAFLLLDVARYRLPPVWIDTPSLWKGMQAIDSESGRSRGFVIVTSPRPTDSAAAPGLHDAATSEPLEPR